MKFLKSLGVLVVVGLGITGAIYWYSHARIEKLVRDTLEDASGEETRGFAAALAGVNYLQPKHYIVSSSTPQFVLLSFDGSKSLYMLQNTLDFARTMNADNKPLHFTYFINGAYFLTEDNSKIYQAPGHAPGESNIGYSNTTPDISIRVKDFNEALAEGHEIGSHTVGHFDGSDWNYNDWTNEFTAFDAIIFNTKNLNLGASVSSFTMTPQNIQGFRAPDLAVNEDMYKALKDFHFTYDTSGVGLPGNWPEKDRYGVWHILLGTISIGQNHTPAIAMDYSLWILQSNGEEMAKQGTPLWNQYFTDVKNAYIDYFNSNYNGSRAPVVIGDHFSLWNDGVYWEAMKSFAEDVCGKPNVKCVTYKELVNYLNTVGPPKEQS